MRQQAALVAIRVQAPKAAARSTTTLQLVPRRQLGSPQVECRATGACTGRQGQGHGDLRTGTGSRSQPAIPSPEERPPRRPVRQSPSTTAVGECDRFGRLLHLGSQCLSPRVRNHPSPNCTISLINISETLTLVLTLSSSSDSSAAREGRALACHKRNSNKSN